MLGSEFMKHVTYVDYKVPGNVFVFWRIACVATQVTSPRVVDKVARLLTKSDLDKFKRNTSSLLEVEELLSQGWETLKVSSLSQDAKHKAFGRYCVRLVLWVTDKQKQGREARTWESASEITAQFGQDLLPGSEHSTAATAAKSSESSEPRFRDLLGASKSEVVLLQNRHLKAGSVYTNSKHGSSLFRLEKLDEEKATFVCSPVMQDSWSVEVPLQEDLASWKITRKELPEVLDVAVALKHGISRSTWVQESIDKAQSQVDLFHGCQACEQMIDQIRFVSGQGLCAAADLPAATLVLPCYGSLYVIDKQVTSLTFRSFGISAMKAPADWTKLDSKSVLVPFWHVKATADHEYVNMTLLKKKPGQDLIPCYVNSKALKKGDFLFCASEALLSKRKAGGVSSTAAPVKRYRDKQLQV